MIRLALYTLLCAANVTLATPVTRCEDEHGHITYTQFGCPSGQQQHLKQFKNPPPGSVYPNVPSIRPAESKRAPSPKINVVGAKESPCGIQLSSEERRRAIIRQQIRAGMTRNDVESSLGRPDSISDHNGQTRYLYEPQQKGSRNKRQSVSFDENGCVKGSARQARK